MGRLPQFLLPFLQDQIWPPMIRDACPQDAAALCNLWTPWIEKTAITFNSLAKSPDEIADLIKERQTAGHAFKVGCDETGQILGFASYSQFRANSGYARTMEHTIILAPQARGYGLGRDLMSAIEDHARLAGHHVMIGCVSGENPAAQSFHLKMGYALWGQLPQVGYKFDRFMDLLILGKLL